MLSYMWYFVYIINSLLIMSSWCRNQCIFRQDSSKYIFEPKERWLFSSTVNVDDILIYQPSRTHKYQNDFQYHFTTILLNTFSISDFGLRSASSHLSTLYKNFLRKIYLFPKLLLIDIFLNNCLTAKFCTQQNFRFK